MGEEWREKRERKKKKCMKVKKNWNFESGIVPSYKMQLKEKPEKEVDAILKNQHDITKPTKLGLQDQDDFDFDLDLGSDEDY